MLRHALARYKLWLRQQLLFLVILPLLVLSCCQPSNELLVVFLLPCHRLSDGLLILFLLPSQQSMKCAYSMHLIPHRFAERIPRAERSGGIERGNKVRKTENVNDKYVWLLDHRQSPIAAIGQL